MKRTMHLIICLISIVLLAGCGSKKIEMTEGSYSEKCQYALCSKTHSDYEVKWPDDEKQYYCVEHFDYADDIVLK